MKEKYYILPFLHRSSKKVQAEFEEYTIIKNFSAGQVIALEGDASDFFYLVLSGAIRVYKCGARGREITLYKVQRGESCILTAFCILSRMAFPAITIADQDTQVALIPAPIFRAWINQYEDWRNYVFNLLSRHLSEILMKIESLAFQTLDERIANYLIQSIENRGNTIKTTHSDIARELGTAREVVSRILKSFERGKLVALKRGNIKVLNSNALLRNATFRVR